jgi:hypothetical protein
MTVHRAASLFVTPKPLSQNDLLLSTNKLRCSMPNRINPDSRAFFKLFWSAAPLSITKSRVIALFISVRLLSQVRVQVSGPNRRAKSASQVSGPIQ